MCYDVLRTLPFYTERRTLSLSLTYWCACFSVTSAGLLASLPRESESVQLHDFHLQSTADFDAETGAFITRRRSHQAAKASADTSDPLASFSWHPTAQNRMITISKQGMVHDMVVNEPVVASFAPGKVLVYRESGHQLQMVVDPCSTEAIL